MDEEIFSLKLMAENVNVVPVSLSAASKSRVIGVSSSVLWSSIPVSSGASFTGITVNSNESPSSNSPSVTLTEITTVPL